MAEEKKNKSKPKDTVKKKPAPMTEEQKREKDYVLACNLVSWSRWSTSYQGRAEQYLQAEELFRTLGDYKDSAKRAEQCAKAAQKSQTEEKEQEYRSLMEQVQQAKTAEDYLYAARALEQFQDHPEAEKAARECNAQSRRLRRRTMWSRVLVTLVLCAFLFGGIALIRTGVIQYGMASVSMTFKDYKRALNWYLKADGFADSADQIVACRFEQGNQFWNQGKYAKAYEQFQQIEEYRDAGFRSVESLCAMLSAVQPGDVVKLGRVDGETLSKWYVLENDGERVTLISEFNVDHVFDESGNAVTWADSDLRVWLNTDFLSATFSKYEREQLAQPVLPSESGLNRTEGGADTVDQVYILSAEEVEQYADVLHAVNEEGKPLDKYKNNGYGWWLRTPGAAETGMAFVDQNGNIDAFGRPVNSEDPGVRPVIQVLLKPAF